MSAGNPSESETHDPFKVIRRGLLVEWLNLFWSSGFLALFLRWMIEDAMAGSYVSYVIMVFAAMNLLTAGLAALKIKEWRLRREALQQELKAQETTLK